MLLCRQRLTLSGKLCKSATDTETSVAWLDNVVDIAIRSSLVWVGKLLCILFFLFCEESLNILTSFLLSLGFLATENSNGTTSTHNGNL